MNNLFYKIMKRVITIIDTVTELFFTQRIKREMLRGTLLLLSLLIALYMLGFPINIFFFSYPSLIYLFLFGILDDFDNENKKRGSYFDIFRDK